MLKILLIKLKNSGYIYALVTSVIFNISGVIKMCTLTVRVADFGTGVESRYWQAEHLCTEWNQINGMANFYTSSDKILKWNELRCSST